MVTIEGTNFLPRHVFCRFGNLSPVSAVYFDNEKIQCLSPTNQRTNVPVSLSISTNGGYDWSEDDVMFEYVRLPSVLSVSPDSGPSLATSDVTISVEFETDDVRQCKHGVSSSTTKQSSFSDGANKTTFTCARDRRTHGGIILDSSTSAMGVRYPSSVAMNDGSDTGPLSSIFYEQARSPAVTGVSPSIGPSTGGTIVTVIGVNFTNTYDLVCMFGEVQTIGRWFSETEVRCRTPKHVPSTVYLEVSNNGFDFSTSGSEYTFHVSPSVVSVWPNHGPERGMTVVTVYGNHFVNTKLLRCQFGGILTPVQRYVSSTEITCYAPDLRRIGRPGSVNIEITNNNQTYTTNGVRYMYDAQAMVSVLSPQTGPSSGNSRVVLYGYGFRDYPTLGCRFGDVAVKGHFVSDTEIECVTPAMPIQTLPVEITLNGDDYTFSKVDFKYEPSIIITNIRV